MILSFTNFILSLTLIQAVFGKEEKTSQYNCSSVELDKLDQISARILSLTEHQRRFPEAVVQIQRYCK